MSKSNVIRIAHGNSTDPTSTRGLRGLSPEEIRHIEHTLDWGIFEANAMINTEDEPLSRMLGQVSLAATAYGLPEQPQPESPDKIRAGLITHREILTKFRNRMMGCFIAGEDSVSGITPKEFEHFIEALQGACREAMIYTQVSAETARKGLEQVNRMAESVGLSAWTAYDKFMDDLPGWFSVRLVVLEGLLKAINQPYHKSEPCLSGFAENIPS